MERKTWTLIAIFIGVLLLSVIDIGLNLFGLLPYIGSAFETASETIVEMMQLLLVLTGFIVASIME